MKKTILRLLPALMILFFRATAYAQSNYEGGALAEGFWNSIFQGGGSQIVKLFDEFTTPFAVLGLIVVFFRFIHMVIKKEIQSSEDLVHFLVERGVRFSVAMILLLPLNIGVVNTEGLPTSIWIFKEVSIAGFTSADTLSKSIHGVDMVHLGATFMKDIDEKATEAQQVWESEVKNTVTGEQRGTISEKFKKVTTTVQGGLEIGKAIAGAGSLNPGTMLTSFGPMLSDAFATGAEKLVRGIRNWLMVVLTAAAVIGAYYGSLIAVLLKYFLYAPFFFFSIVLLFFDRTKDAVVRNLMKAVGLMLYPIGLVIAFTVLKIGFVFYIEVIQRVILDGVDASVSGQSVSQAVTPGYGGPVSGFCLQFILLFTIVSIYTAATIGVFRGMFSFIGSMLGEAFEVVIGRS